MSNAAGKSPLEPYAPPVETGYTGAAPTRSPGGLKAVCIISIVLGGLGLASGLMQLVMLFVAPMMQQAFTPGPVAQGGPQAEIVQLQQQMQAEMAELNRRYFAFQLVAGAAHLAVAAMLLAGGIMALSLKPAGRSILLAGCGAAILFEMARAVLDTLVKMEWAKIYGRFIERMMQASAGGAGGGPDPQVFNSMVTVFTYVFLGLGLVFVLGRVIYYVFALLYLRKPHIAAMYR